MIVVVDTNIIVKYALDNPDAVKAIDCLCDNGKIAVNKSILNEYKLVLARKKLKISHERQQAVIKKITDNSQIFELSFFRFNKDREDEKFLSAAQTSKADFLITNDKAIKNAQWKIKTKIINLQDFESFKI